MSLKKTHIHSIWFIRKSNLRVGGVEMQMIRQARWFRQHAGISSILVTDHLQGDLARLFRDDGFETFHCPLDGPRYLVRATQSLSNLLKGKRGVLLQAHMFRESMVCRMAKLFNPDVKHYFRVETYIDCSPLPESRKRAYHLAARISARLVDRYFANGTLVAEELIKRSRVSAQSVTTIYNGVEPFGTPVSGPLTYDDDGCLQTACVANLLPGKGHELLFRALALVNEKARRLRVYLYGDEMDPATTGGLSFREELQRMALNAGVEKFVRFCGFSANLVRDLTGIRVILLPSDSEGTPNCILEAMSSERLVVVSDAGELPFIVNNGEAGILHKRGDLEDLVHALTRLLDSNASEINRLRKNGYERWQALFSLDAVMRQMEPYYREH